LWFARLNRRSSRTSRTYTAAIFDFEGTLVDFQWQLAPAETELRRAFAEMGFDCETFARGNYATMWNTAADLLARQGRLDRLRRALCPIYDRWDLDALSRWAPRPGAAELLGRLAAAGARVGMVSNVGRDALMRALSRFDFARWLSPVVNRDDVTYMKPRPEGVLRVLTEWRVTAGDALFVGDSRADVIAARAAGMAVAIIRGGECDEDAFAEAAPDHLISQLNELVEIIA
jgi:phosphoglycolate phosphatase